MIIVIYTLLAFIATFFGALVGLGGGVIVKPALDIISPYSSLVISALSSTTIFFMTVVTIVTNIRSGITIERSLYSVALGGVFGGFIGKLLLYRFVVVVGSDTVAKGIQALILGVLMLVVFALVRREVNDVREPNFAVGFVVGVVLGTLSSFLGIGGGPLNVIVLVMFCGVDKKYAAFGSVFLIFASQGTKLLTLLVQGQTAVFVPQALMGLIPGAIVGAYLGSRLYRRLSSAFIVRVFSIAVLLLAVLNFGVVYMTLL